MSTIEAKLTYLNDTKNLIKDALIAKGATIDSSTPYRDYATTIENLPSGSVSTSPSSEWSQAYYDSVYAASLVTPTEWLTIPELAETDQKVHILVAVYDCSSNFTAFTCAGDYTVDWGDGTSNSYASGVKAEHEYTYSNINLNSNTVSKYGYKQCLLTITPQSGQTFTSLDFDQYNTSIGSGTSYDMTQPFVAMSIAGQSISSLVLSQTKTYVSFSVLKYFRLQKNNITDMNNMFNNCSSLTTIPLLNISSVTDMNNMFYGCQSLTTIPLLNTSLVTDMSSMFYSCYNLKRIQSPISFTNKLSNFKLSSTELNEIYTNLPTKTGQTLTVTGNWGTASDNPAIATAKGWTITG